MVEKERMSKLEPCIRRYRPSDRAQVRDICASTGFLGESISVIFPKHEFFVDYLTSYYTDQEPNSCFVLTNGPGEDGAVVGYLISCTDPKKYARYQANLLLRLIVPAVCSVLTAKTSLSGGDFKMRGQEEISWPAVKRRFLEWLIFRGWREIPKVPPNGAHFHFNILKPWRSVATTRRLVDAFLDMVKREHKEIPVVWGQMETMAGRSSEELFLRLGWRFYDKVRLTKYQDLFDGHPPSSVARKLSGNVYLTTIYREMDGGRT